MKEMKGIEEEQNEVYTGLPAVDMEARAKRALLPL